MVFLSHLLSRARNPLYRSRNLRARFQRTKDENTPKNLLMLTDYPITQTTKYLENGIIFRDCVKCVTIHYSDYEDPIKQAEHQSLKRLVDINFHQLQYKNPDVQILVIKDVLPSPFITFFLEDGDRFHIDADGKSHIELLRYIQKIVGKPRELIEMEAKAVLPNPANFGPGYARNSITEVPGQLPSSDDFYDIFPKESLDVLCVKGDDIKKRWKQPE